LTDRKIRTLVFDTATDVGYTVGGFVISFVRLEGCSDFYPDVLKKWACFHLAPFQFHYNKNILLFKAS
jgi:hypothetical protein